MALRRSPPLAHDAYAPRWCCLMLARAGSKAPGPLHRLAELLDPRPATVSALMSGRHDKVRHGSFRVVSICGQPRTGRRVSSYCCLAGITAGRMGILTP